MLILAGVSIATLTGENGILTRAQDAREKTEQAKEDELRKLTQAEAATYLEEHEYTDVSGEKVTIPAKCAVSQVEGENTLEDGLVIIDANGNEWVWIEVPESVTASSITDEEIKNALNDYANEYRDTNYSDTWYEDCGLEEQEYADRYSEMLQSIKANHGFYIGRYEVGSFDNPVTAADTSRKAVIQKGAYPYNWVNMTDAEEVAEGLSIGGKRSTLIFGIQYDLVLKYLELNGDWDTAIDEKSYYLKNDSSTWGNYRNADFTVEPNNKYAICTKWTIGEWDVIPVNYKKPAYDTDGEGILLSTGASEKNSKMNIYDLAGNVYERTLEKSSDDFYTCVVRGGCYNEGGFNTPVSYRYATGAWDRWYSTGFHSVLY